MKRATGVVPVLSVSPFPEDHLALEHLLLRETGDSCDWALHASFTLDAAIAALRKKRVPILITESDLCPCTWRDLLQKVAELPDPPLVIVTSALADEYLWAEALNLGAYNVLAKPFCRSEVSYVLEVAWRAWTHCHAAAPAPAAPPRVSQVVSG